MSGHLTGHCDSIDAMAMSGNRQTLVTGSSDGTAVVWDISSPRESPSEMSRDVGVGDVASTLAAPSQLLALGLARRSRLSRSFAPSLGFSITTDARSPFAERNDVTAGHQLSRTLHYAPSNSRKAKEGKRRRGKSRRRASIERCAATLHPSSGSSGRRGIQTHRGPLSDAATLGRRDAGTPSIGHLEPASHRAAEYALAAFNISIRPQPTLITFVNPIGMPRPRPALAPPAPLPDTRIPTRTTKRCGQ